MPPPMPIQPPPIQPLQTQPTQPPEPTLMYFFIFFKFITKIGMEIWDFGKTWWIRRSYERNCCQCYWKLSWKKRLVCSFQIISQIRRRRIIHRYWIHGYQIGKPRPYLLQSLRWKNCLLRHLGSNASRCYGCQFWVQYKKRINVTWEICYSWGERNFERNKTNLYGWDF